MTELPVLLQQFVTRYRTALLAKAGVLAALSLGVFGVLAWRLHPLRVPPVWSVWIPAGASVAVACGMAWWVRRRWVSPGTAASYLDRALDLQQRLLTAAEFAQASEKPSLYSRLVDDVAQRYTTRQLRFPRPVDRTAGILAAVLLVMLLWPGVRPPVRLASVPPNPPIPQPPSTPPPPTPDQRSEQQQQQQQTSSQQPSPSSQPNQSQAQSGGTGSSAANREGAGSKDSSGRRGQEGHGDGQGAEQAQPSGQGQSSSQKDAGSQGAGSKAAGSQHSSRDEAKSGQQDSGGQQRSAGSQQAKGGGDGSRAQASARDANQQGAAQSQAQGSQGAASQSAASQHGQQQGGQQGGQQPTPGAGGALSAADQEALKAQIQELLKEVSGELKTLQEQLASANDQPKSQAGTGTDPNLYDAPEPMERPTGAALPIQLQTDAVQTKSQRPGSGTGRPSGELSSSTPQTSAEEASLSDTPLEEPSASREVVPPEYRTIFEQLRNHASQPSEQSP